MFFMDKKKKIILLIVSVLTAVLILAACENKFTVKFDTDGGTPIQSLSVDKKSLLNEVDIPVPIKDGYTFAGWYKDGARSKQWDFSKDKVNKNLTLYAKYVPIPTAFSFTLNADGQSYTVAANPTGNLNIVGSLEIPSQYSGKPVTAIAAEGFSATASRMITGVVIPSSVLSIGDKAFYKCAFMNKVEFKPDSNLKEIGASAFEGIPLVREIQFPASLEIIGENAFKDNLALKTAAFADGSRLKDLKKYAFAGCIALENCGVATGTSYVLPASLAAVGDYAFNNDARLKNTGFAASGAALETIGTYAFYKTALTSLFLPNTLKTVGSYAFSENQSLVDLTFGADSVIKEIPGYMFQNCIALSAVELPASVAKINYYAFSNTKALKKVVMNSYISDYNLFYNTRIIEPETKATAVVVPKDNLAGYKTQNASYSKYIVSIDADEGTASSYTKIIDNKYVLSVVTVGENITSSVIVYFGNDESVVIDGNIIPNAPLKTVDKFAFAGSRTLKKAEIINASGYTVADSAFANCVNLEEALVSGVKELGKSAFAETALFSLELGNALEKIGNAAFQNCKKLTAVSIPSSVNEISGFAFAGCKALETVSFANGSALEKIGESAFKDDAALFSISLPDSVASIGAGAFWNCAALEYITLPSSLTKIQTLTFAATGLRRVVIPSNVTNIDSNAFRGCSAIAEIDFSAAAALTSIGESAFAVHSDKNFDYKGETFNKYLHSVTLPSSLITVGANAFARTMVKVITVSSLINADLNNIPDLSALLTLNGRVILIDDAAGQELYDAYKTIEAAKYKDNAFVAAKSAVDSNGFILGGDYGDTLIAYVGAGTNPDLNGIRIIGSFAFAYNTKITGMDIPVSVGVIGESAFESCINLETIIFADKTGTTNSYSIYKNAFKNCSSAGINNDVIIRGPVSFVGPYAFSGWSNAQTITFDGIKETDTTNWASNWYSESFAAKNFK
jgi:uncharacterized repeat protein (TIGR02543 family)